MGINRWTTPISTEVLNSTKIFIVLQDGLYTLAWEIEFESISDIPVPYQKPNVIDSYRVIDNEIPNDTEQHKKIAVKIFIRTRSLIAGFFET